jgi:hypothetical protein
LVVVTLKVPGGGAVTTGGSEVVVVDWYVDCAIAALVISASAAVVDKMHFLTVASPILVMWSGLLPTRKDREGHRTPFKYI